MKHSNAESRRNFGRNHGGTPFRGGGDGGTGVGGVGGTADGNLEEHGAATFEDAASADSACAEVPSSEQRESAGAIVQTRRGKTWQRRRWSGANMGDAKEFWICLDSGVDEMCMYDRNGVVSRMHVSVGRASGLIEGCGILLQWRWWCFHLGDRLGRVRARVDGTQKHRVAVRRRKEPWRNPGARER